MVWWGLRAGERNRFLDKNIAIEERKSMREGVWRGDGRLLGANDDPLIVRDNGAMNGASGAGGLHPIHDDGTVMDGAPELPCHVSESKHGTQPFFSWWMKGWGMESVPKPA
jgi:hypothetical protein